MIGRIREVKAALDADGGADFSHVAFTVTSQTNGYRIAGRYIVLYHATEKPDAFPEGYFTILVRTDGTVTNLREGWE